MGENVFSRFYTLLILEIREKVSRNRINNKKCLEMGENRRNNKKYLEMGENRRNNKKCLKMGENVFFYF